MMSKIEKWLRDNETTLLDEELITQEEIEEFLRGNIDINININVEGDVDL